MRARIGKRFHFSAGHWLPHVPRGHKCRRPHGHTYGVELICDGPVRADGMLVDYAKISACWEPLKKRLDHHTLNDIRGLENPTAELLAAFILKRMPPFVTTVRVSETPETFAEVSR